MIEKIKVNQINQPLGNYNANQYTFTEEFYYSGYIYNASNQNSLTIQITLTEGNVLPNIVIPANAILKIENLTIFQMNISNGYYTFSFLGSNFPGIPKIYIDPQNTFIYAMPYSTNGKLYTSKFSVNNTITSTSTPNPQPLTYYDSNIDNNLMYEVVLKADPTNTDYIWISGASGSLYGYRLAPGEELDLFMINPSEIYVWTGTNDQVLYVLIVGSGASGNPYHTG
jgi:hypothetical protein